MFCAALRLNRSAHWPSHELRPCLSEPTVYNYIYTYIYICIYMQLWLVRAHSSSTFVPPRFHGPSVRSATNRTFELRTNGAQTFVATDFDCGSDIETTRTPTWRGRERQTQTQRQRQRALGYSFASLPRSVFLSSSLSSRTAQRTVSLTHCAIGVGFQPQTCTKSEGETHRRQ